jgi:sugar-specific transcriptional regulator TrmB
MTSDSEESETIEEATEQLEQLGLKEYEARCFVGLSRGSGRTAKEISDLTGVPRTRVYDATRALEAKGLIEVQHGSPKRFRAVPVDEAVGILRNQFESRFDSLEANLKSLDRPGDEPRDEVHEVWSIGGGETIAQRTRGLVEEAREEVVVLVAVEELVDEELLDGLNDATERGVDVVVGTVDEGTRRRVEGSVEGVEPFVSELEWLRPEEDGAGGETAIGRILLVDRSTILVSTYEPQTRTERGVFGRGFTNGLVVIARRLLSTGAPVDSASLTD